MKRMFTGRARLWIRWATILVLAALGLPAIYLLVTDGRLRYAHFLYFERRWNSGWNYVASIPRRIEPRLLEMGVLANGLIEARLGDGIWMLIDPQDAVDRYNLGWGRWEKAEMEWIRERIKPSDVFVDVGAHHGSYALRVARLLNGGGLVLAVEPNPESVRRLEINIRLNKLNNIRVYPVACGESSGQATLYVASPKNTGMASLSAETAARSGPGGAARTYTVQVIPLDDLSDSLQGRRISVLKVDTEGAETSVLRGATKTIRHHRPVIIVESIPRQLEAMGSSLEEMESLLRSFGYEKTGESSNNALWEPRFR